MPPGCEQDGPPLRPVAGAEDSPNMRLSHFLSMMVNLYADSAEHVNECRSSEEMRVVFEDFNGLTTEVKQNCKL